MDDKTLFDYQVESINWLKDKKQAILAHEMGLGKTVIAIKAFDEITKGSSLTHTQASVPKALVICPSVARINWLREFEMWSNIKRQYFLPEKLSENPPDDHTTICSYDYVAANYSKLCNKTWDVLIVDEAHFIKSVNARRTKAILGSVGVARASKRQWLLTGTPAPNNPSELWVYLYTFGVTKLKHDAFMNRYCKVRHTSYGPSIYGAQNIPELRVLLAKVMLRFLKKDVMKELPPIKYGITHVLPGPVELDFQASFAHFFFPNDRTEELQKILSEENHLASVMLNRTRATAGEKLPIIEGLWRGTSTIRRFVGLQKVQAIVELVKTKFNGGTVEKLVIFAVHRDVIENLRVELRKLKLQPLTLYGGMPAWKRQKNIDKFQTEARYKVFIAQVDAAGTAITLTAAHDLIFAELSYSPAVMAQCVMRCHRIGQVHKVNIEYILLDNSFDSSIGKVLKRKVMMLTQIFD